MNRNDLLRRIQVRGRDIIDEFFPSDANADLDSLIGDRRHEVDPQAYRMFVAVRALLRESGMPSCESDCEAGQIMALLNSRAA
ncbi:hypothetical protein M3I53_32055 [Paraburkholderia sp. CNPSo 3272]|uniref:hypothetical protein n=1 Tax=Paraburkholderia sp. CNPSo 3272 TaxID=2940931 RepID=UPI0020B81793|nr:hypothetical protein [Paraburkholderia sp. CNPSo 3272]MCP3727704.1 hypothetical protein [Paraburkholderia sp. CNPSo 3272]